MVDCILAGVPLLRNDLRIVARIFEQTLDYYQNHSSLLVSEYLQELRTLIGHGFTAALAEGHLLHVYQPQLACFMAAQEELNTNQQAKRRMAQSTAELVHVATLCFYKLKFPPYYHNFLALLRHTLSQVPGVGWENEVERLLKHLS